MTYIATIHTIDEAHLAAVMGEMRELGAPTIRAYNDGGMLIALEGCHRLEAARRLGLTLDIIEVGENDDLTDHGLQDFEGEAMTVMEVLDYIGTPEGTIYRLTDDGLTV